MFENTELARHQQNSQTNIGHKMIDKLTIPITIVVILFFVKLMNPIFYDTDFYWHLKTGEYIVSTLSVPRTDIFSHTYFGKSWVSHEWLTEAIIYITSHFFGFTGIRILVALTFTCTFYALFHLARKIIQNDNKAIIVSLLFFAPNIMFASPRPQLFSFLFFSLFLYVLLEYKYFGVTKRFKLLPIIMLVWVNLHAAFVVGIVLLTLFLISEWSMLLFRDKTDNAKRRDLRYLTVILICTILVTLINPQFIQLWIYPFQVVNMEAVQNIISEWRSPDFHLFIFKYYLFLIICFFVMLIYSHKKPDLTEMAVPIFFIVSGMTALRHLPLTCFTLIPFFAMFYNDKAWRTGPIQSTNFSAVTENPSPQQIDRFVPRLNFLMLIIVAATVIFIEFKRHGESVVEASLPVKAANFIEKYSITGNMFNNYNDGGYLIYRLAPNRKVFIDGRGDMYGDNFIKVFIKIYNGGAGWKEQFDKFSIDFVVCEKDAAIRQLLLEEGSFKEAYQDELDSVLLRNIPKNQALIAMRR